MDTVGQFIGPVTSLIGAAAPVAASFLTKNSMPKMTTPATKPTPTMPTPDDATSRSAALREIAKRSSSHGRQGTNLYEKEPLG